MTPATGSSLEIGNAKAYPPRLPGAAMAFPGIAWWVHRPWHTIHTRPRVPRTSHSTCPGADPTHPAQTVEVTFTTLLGWGFNGHGPSSQGPSTPKHAACTLQCFVRASSVLKPISANLCLGDEIKGIVATTNDGSPR